MLNTILFIVAVAFLQIAVINSIILCILEAV